MDLIADPNATLNAAIADDHAGRRDVARLIMGDIAGQWPDWDEPLLRIAESLRADGLIDAAIHAYWRVLATNPARPEALVALGGLLLIRTQPAVAVVVPLAPSVRLT